VADMSSEVVQFKTAETPAKDEILAYLQECIEEVKKGEVLALVLIPIHPNRHFSIRSVGDIRMLELAGLLGRAHFDALTALED